VAGRQIPVDMVYVGSKARSVDGSELEPCLIDPSLPVNWNRPDWTGSTMGYWPSYSAIKPEARAAYLSWLGAGRRVPDTYIGYVFLYFYGLERRVLKDITSTTDPQLTTILEEVSALASVYGDNHSFRSYSSSFIMLLHTIRLLGQEIEPPAWSPENRDWELPWSVRLGVGRLVSEGEPIPAEWALSYLRHHPLGNLRTPATRCRSEFDELFTARYGGRYGQGLVVPAPKKTMEIEYRPASSGMGIAARVDAGVPDVAQLTALLDPLQVLGSECIDALDAYSRYLGRQPDDRESAAAVALLPKELLARRGGPIVDGLRSWSESALDVRDQAFVLIDDLLERYSPGIAGPLGKKDLVGLTSLLAKVGIGMEPDPRFGSPTAKFGTNVVLFRLPDGAAAAPTRSYSAAMSLVHLTAVVAAADGTVSPDEQRHLVNHAESALGLDAPERVRLEAYLLYLAQTKIGTALIRKQVEELPVAERARVGAFLVSVAMADGTITPDEIATLVKVFGQLGLTEADVYRQIHGYETGDPGPVTVRRDDPAARYAISDAGAERPAPSVQLDPAKVQARIAETAQVSAMLANIFADDPTSPFAPPSAGTAVALPPPGQFAGPPAALWRLDAAHTALAKALAAQDSWSRDAAEELASELGLPLLNGAIDRINEAALDACGDTLIDGDDTLELNRFTVEEMK